MHRKEFALTKRNPPLGPAKPGKGGRPANEEKPAWADGLRKLYDSVVSEPLPDSFDDLLKKLDPGDDG